MILGATPSDEPYRASREKLYFTTAGIVLYLHARYCLSLGVAPIISLTVIKYDSPLSSPSRDPVFRFYHVSF